MELTDDLVAIQGILISAIKGTGEFIKITYKGGNEEKILKIIGEIQKYMSSKNYIKNGKINNVFDQQIENIVLFLAINTKYKKLLEMKDYTHLIDIMPQLSKCLLANIIYGLDLCQYYCKVIETLPISFGIELLEEMIPCLKKSLPEIQLRYAIMFLKVTALKLSSLEVSEKVEDDVYNISEVAAIILQFLTGIYPGHVKNLKAVQIYQHMGYILLSLFELLLYCNKENHNLKKFVDNVIMTCCVIIKNVTITVFCSWAEIKEGDEPLQNLVAGKAYEVVEEYQKYKEAIELISMLGTIARKPMSLSECVQKADIETIIKKVNLKNEYQKTWFQALLGTQVLDNKNAMRCVCNWAHLCDENDVTRLLNLSRQSKDDESKLLVMKCVSTLTLEKLLIVMPRYLYENKFKGLVSNTDNVESQLKLIFNKMSGQTETDDNFIKDMCLLMLQSPDIVLKGVYGQCLRNKCYTTCYETFFSTIKDTVKINNYGIEVLWQVISGNQPDDSNIDNYVALFLSLREIGFLSNSQIINDLLLPMLDQFRWEKGYEQLGTVLQIFLCCSLKVQATPEMTNIRWALLNTINDCRCTFLELDINKQQAANYAIDIIINLCEVDPNYNFEDYSNRAAEITKYYDEFTNYYKDYLSSKTDLKLLHALYSGFDIENYAVCVSMMLRFLPCAVTSEWSTILQEVTDLCDREKAMELVTDIMILLCKVAQSQNPNTNTGSKVVTALKYCLQQYGIAMQNIQQDSTIEVEVDITKNICRLLKYLPEVLKEEEGLPVMNILTQRSLKLLNNDREFVCSLISINNSFLCNTIAQRLME